MEGVSGSQGGSVAGEHRVWDRGGVVHHSHGSWNDPENVGSLSLSFEAGGWLPFSLMLACSTMGLQGLFPCSFPCHGHGPHLNPQQKHPQACLAPPARPSNVLSVPRWDCGTGAATMLGKSVGLFQTCAPCRAYTISPMQQPFPISPGPGRGANLAVSLHGSALC